MWRALARQHLKHLPNGALANPMFRRCSGRRDMGRDHHIVTMKPKDYLPRPVQDRLHRDRQQRFDRCLRPPAGLPHRQAHPRAALTKTAPRFIWAKTGYIHHLVRFLKKRNVEGQYIDGRQ